MVTCSNSALSTEYSVGQEPFCQRLIYLLLHSNKSECQLAVGVGDKAYFALMVIIFSHIIPYIKISVFIINTALHLRMPLLCEPQSTLI